MKNLVCLLLYVLCMNRFSTAEFCSGNMTFEPLDMTRLSKMKYPLYDVIDIPAAVSHVDCWDVATNEEVNDGFIMTMTQQVEGRAAKKSLDIKVHFIHNGDGTYKVDPGLKKSVIITSKKSVKHKADEKMLQEVENALQTLYASTFFFLTDYSSYFIMAACAPGNKFIGLIKHKTLEPSGKDVVQLWNVMAKYGESTTAEWESYCTSRTVTRDKITLDLK